MKKIYYLAKDTYYKVCLVSNGYTNKQKLIQKYKNPKYKKDPYYINWVWDDLEGRKEFQHLQYLQRKYGKIVNY